MTERIDTSTWPPFVLVRTDKLRVVKVDHEVVEWDASFCSEDSIIGYNEIPEGRIVSDDNGAGKRITGV